MNECLICKRIELIKEGKNPYFVKELQTGYVVLGDYQYYKGYTLFLCKKHKTELYQLDHKFAIKFLEEMMMVSKAVYQVFKPAKLNYEMLGNGDPHMHWHIFPRYLSDQNFKLPIWVVDKSVRYSKSAKATIEEMKEMKKQLLKYL